MPVLNKYSERDTVVVAIAPDVNYVFETNVDKDERNALGHVAVVAGASTIGAFLGANSPKPRRARRLTSTGWNSSFCAEASVAALKAGGWQVGAKPKKRAVITSAAARSITVYVAIGGIKYAWNMPRETYNKITAATATDLGIKVATEADTETLVWGSTKPKPARVQTILTGGLGPVAPGGPVIDGQDVLTTFCSVAAENTLPAGWKVIAPRVTFA
jgi:hypothetical protein